MGLGGKGNEGVSATVKQTPGAIGYVELGYALINKLPAAAVRNKAGKFVTPALASVTAAAAGAMKTMGPNTDFRVSITDPDGATRIPIASFTWFLIHKDYQDAAKAKAIANFVWCAETDGQARLRRPRVRPAAGGAAALDRGPAEEHHGGRPDGLERSGRPVIPSNRLSAPPPKVVLLRGFCRSRNGDRFVTRR